VDVSVDSFAGGGGSEKSFFQILRNVNFNRGGEGQRPLFISALV
jgi:hypothetical protein